MVWQTPMRLLNEICPLQVSFYSPQKTAPRWHLRWQVLAGRSFLEEWGFQESRPGSCLGESCSLFRIKDVPTWRPPLGSAWAWLPGN